MHPEGSTTVCFTGHNNHDICDSQSRRGQLLTYNFIICTTTSLSGLNSLIHTNLKDIIQICMEMSFVMPQGYPCGESLRTHSYPYSMCRRYENCRGQLLLLLYPADILSTRELSNFLEKTSTYTKTGPDLPLRPKPTIPKKSKGVNCL